MQHVSVSVGVDYLNSYRNPPHLVVIWCSGSALVSIKKITYVGPVSTVMGDRVRVQFPVPDIYLSV